MEQDILKKEEKKSFKDTLNLPHTDFPIRPHSQVDDPVLLERWKQEDIYTASFELNKGNKKYILHDGPPYANGNIHLGHAYNKILKDIVCKSYRMSGYQVPVTPGWDCHGLPIELKVTQEHPQLDRTELKKACRKYAQHWIDVQRESFKALGVLMNWNKPYITMDYSYEAAVIRSFGMLVKQGFIERKNKTVPWCPHCKTVLASAEIEYKDRKDPSIYVLFDLQEQDIKQLFEYISGKVSLVIWTTTPWTIPLNQAVLIKPLATYVLFAYKDQYIITGEATADKLCTLLGIEKTIITTFSSDYLTGIYVKHPLIDRAVPLVFDESVGLQDGTALVQCAPGCGLIDYEIGIKNNLNIFSPISADGRYTSEVELPDLVNMLFSDGQIWVIKKLVELNKMLYKTNIVHSYPHCWRCHNGLIFRATLQWFFDLNHENIKQNALATIERIEFKPMQGRNFLRATVESRWEWCLSRQRIWGVPIPALLCKSCDKTYLSSQLVEKIAIQVAQHGVEYWDTVTINELIDQAVTCDYCKGCDFVKEQDILDVWFDAGISHYAVLYKNPELAFPADIYVEGVDQHRGWFQSSLLTSLVLEREPCTKSIMTHGYTVDAKGQKMSKSLGNVVSPEDIIKQIGTDGLRLWVASVGYDGDPVVSDVLLKNISEVYRKIRNTCRFLLSNLYDFSPNDKLPIEQLLPLDKYAFAYLAQFNKTMIDNYLSADFTAVSHQLAEYCAVELSSFYLDIIKDRLYVEKASGYKRRSAQTVIWYLLDTITRIMAPILSFTAEYVSDCYQKDKKSSIHLQPFACLEKHLLSAGIKNLQNYLRHWHTLKHIRSAVLKAIEVEREKGIIKHSLEAQVTLYIDYTHPTYQEVKKLLDDFSQDFFKEFFIVSRVICLSDKDNLSESITPGVYVRIDKAQGKKCPRCWQWDSAENADDLCDRCVRVIF